MADLALSISSVSKSFGGIHAVDGVSLEVPQGERRVMIGPNGAGKTTLFHCVSGAHRVTSGSIQLFGEEISQLPEHERTLKGMGRTFQISSVFVDLTALENVQLAVLGIRPEKWTPWKQVGVVAGVNERAMEKLELVGLGAKAHTGVRQMSYGERRQLELALALVNEPRLLLLDEPCAGLSPAERQRLFKLIQGLPRSLTMLMIEHDMDVALGLADRITVLHRGQIMLEGSVDEVRINPQVREVYFGQV